MSVDAPSRGNFDLKEEIRAYWGERSKTYDLSAGHRIAEGAEAAAWAEEFRQRLGDAPLNVLELGCGTGEITGVLHGLGHHVTALDFSEAMLARARSKHAGKPRLHFVLADAGNTMEPDGHFDAVVCRNLVWTLTEPMAAFGEWRRVLKPGERWSFSTATGLGRRQRADWRRRRSACSIAGSAMTPPTMTAWRSGTRRSCRPCPLATDSRQRNWRRY